MIDRASNPPLPRWDLTPIFPGLDSREFTSSVRELETRIAGLSMSLDTDTHSIDRVARMLERYNEALEVAEIVEGYTECLTLENATNERARSWTARVRQLRLELQRIERRLMAGAASLEHPATAEMPLIVREHSFWMEQARISTTHSLSPDEEALAGKLHATGGLAWEMLRHQIVDSMTAVGDPELPFAAIQHHASDPSRIVRANTYRAEMSAWEVVAPSVAAALNGIKGEVLTMSRQRRWETPLDQSLEQNRIDHDVLDAMLSAAESALPDMRRYLAIKARLLRLPQLAWYDLYAPVASDAGNWPFDTACELVLEEFGRYSDAARLLVETALSQRWIDAEPRPEKRAGGMCLAVGSGRSRILVGYTPLFDRLRMLAHELGHAYHASVLNRAGRSAVQRWMTPWVLSESAAIFFENLVRDAAVETAEPSCRLGITESNLQTLCRRVIDVLSAFRFEQHFFERRVEGPLSANEIMALMTAAQRETYGDGLDPEATHPYMWAALPHYYSTESAFNNYPYMFGTLFGLALSTRFQAHGPGFSAEFDDFLSRTSMDSTTALAARLGIDLHSTDFWRSGVEVIRNEIDRFERLSAAESG